jgi:hypothetical protein
MFRPCRAATAAKACTATADLLHDHGFVDIHARIEPAPQPDNVGTLLVEARCER